MAARQANCSHLPDVSFFRYFVFTEGERTGDDRAGTVTTGIGREMKVLLFHGRSDNTRVTWDMTLDGKGLLAGYPERRSVEPLHLCDPMLAGRKRLAALQATCFRTGCDQPAEGANP